MKPVRWYVRLEALRAPKFGETRRDVTKWAVFTYRDRDAHGNPIPIYRPLYFNGRAGAFAYALRMARGARV